MTLYRLYVDEVGNDDLTHLEGERYLSLTGVAMERNHARDAAGPALARLKAEVFRHDPDRPVILHRKDIINRRNVFHALLDDDCCRRFDDGLCALLSECDYSVISVLIDKLEMTRQHHWANRHPYHFLMEVMVEKYVQWLERKNGYGDIMPERRKGKKDAALQSAYEQVLATGTHFVSAARIRRRIRANKLKFRGKEDNVTGLQICDCGASPSHNHIRLTRGHPIELTAFAQRICDVLVSAKYDRGFHGKIEGYGIKYLP